MSAQQSFLDAARVCQSIWSAQQEAAARYQTHRRLFRQAADPNEKALADTAYALHTALVEAAAVRLATAWEVFLQDLFEEYLVKRPDSLRSAWRFRAKGVQVTETTVARILQDAGRPFQDWNRAKDFLKKYLGRDLIGQGNTPALDINPVLDLLAVRHAIVHRGGLPTRQFRDRLGTRKAARGYLTSRVAPHTLLATQFDRLLVGVTTTAQDLYARAWQRPRP